MADTLLIDIKSSTKDVDKGTDELADMKQKVSTICRKGYISLRVNLSDLKDGLNLILSFSTNVSKSHS